MKRTLSTTRFRGRLTVVGSAVVASALLVLTSCAGAGAIGTSDGTVVTIAMVSNPQMQDAVKLAPQYEAMHPGIHLKFVTLPENQARAKITVSAAMSDPQFDAVMISNYEASMWGKNGWLRNLSPYAESTPGYDVDDFIPSLRNALSYEDRLYAVPFYGESSFLMYRKDLFDAAGITVPKQPTWDEVASYAAELDDPDNDMAGICMRGLSGWGMNMAPLTTVVNTMGGRYYDENWNAQLTSPETAEAVQFYVDTLRDYGPPGAATIGFSECATLFAQGHAAMWYDATANAGFIEDPASSTVAGNVGYALAPKDIGKTNWLYAWTLGIPTAAEHPDQAWDFIAWMTNKDYMVTVGETFGWSHVPPGSRTSTYDIPEYKEESAAYGPLTLEAIEDVDSVRPTVQPVPYTGGQFVQIPEFQDLGTQISQQVSAAIAGQTTVEDALEESQKYADIVGDTYQEQK